MRFFEGHMHATKQKEEKVSPSTINAIAMSSHHTIINDYMHFQQTGKMDAAQLDEYKQHHHRTPAHPAIHRAPNTTGTAEPRGQGRPVR